MDVPEEWQFGVYVPALIDRGAYRESLEDWILPWVTSRKTKFPIIFRGKKRYLKPLGDVDSADMDRKIATHALQALQCLYATEHAINDGDANAVFKWGTRFGQHLVNIGGLFECGSNVNEALAGITRRREIAAKGGKATAKWTPEIERKAREIFDGLKRARVKDTAAYLRTSIKLNSEHGLDFSASTVRRHLKNSNA